MIDNVLEADEVKQVHPKGEECILCRSYELQRCAGRRVLRSSFAQFHSGAGGFLPKLGGCHLSHVRVGDSRTGRLDMARQGPRPHATDRLPPRITFILGLHLNIHVDGKPMMAARTMTSIMLAS